MTLEDMTLEEIRANLKKVQPDDQMVQILIGLALCELVDAVRGIGKNVESIEENAGGIASVAEHFYGRDMGR